MTAVLTSPTAALLLLSLDLSVQECEKEGQPSGTGPAVAILSSFLTQRVGDAAQGSLPSLETTWNLESGNPAGPQQQCSGPV